MSSSTMNTKLPEATHDRFMAYWADRHNWMGYPLVGGNVGGDQADTGYLTRMKKAGLVTTHVDEGDIWLTFTPAGEAYAARYE